MSILTPHERYQWRILDELETGAAVSQRALSARLGIALGLTNQLLKELVSRRLLRSNRVGLRVKYEITRAGVSHHQRIARQHMHEVMRAYAVARMRIEQRLAALASKWPANGPRRVAVYDDGEGVSEIGCMCLRKGGFDIVGVIADDARSSGVSWSELSGRQLQGESFDRLIVMSFRPAGPIRASLRRRGVPGALVFWV